MKSLIEAYKLVCELILEFELDLLETRKDSAKQDVLLAAQDYRDALWRLIVRTKGDPYNK